MDGGGGKRCKPGRQEDLVGLVVSGKHGPPAADGAGLHVGIATGEQQCVDVERDEGNVSDESKEMVAGGASCGPRAGAADEMVDGVQADDHVNARLSLSAHS